MLVCSPRGAPGMPQLLEPELEHVRETARALGERRGLQQRLLVERLDVEVLGEEIDEGLVVDAAAQQIRLAYLLAAQREVAAHERAHRVARAGRERRRVGCAPGDRRLAVGVALELA